MGRTPRMVGPVDVSVPPSWPTVCDQCDVPLQICPLCNGGPDGGIFGLPVCEACRASGLTCPRHGPVRPMARVVAGEGHTVDG